MNRDRDLGTDQLLFYKFVASGMSSWTLSLLSKKD